MAKRTKIGFDPKCAELAEYFLNDYDLSQYENDVNEQLAMFIQKEIEDWLNYDLQQFKKKEET